MKDYKLIFDAECPMCARYSKTFIKIGMIDDNVREAYQEMSPTTCTLIDKNRARNEIALVNTKTGEVYYGIDSIFKVLANRFPILKSLFGFAPFYWLMKKAYAFIAYNRKIIVPGDSIDDTCVPDFNLKYRVAYILFTWMLTSIILTFYSDLLLGIVPKSRFLREFIICGGQIIFQAVIIHFIARGRVYQYLGNMMSISAGASLILILPIIIWKVFSISNPILFATIFMLVVLMMLIEHIRRMKLIKISWIASFSWVIYRIIVLTIILLKA